MNESNRGSTGQRILDAVAFASRATAEVARVHRNGGLLSALLIGVKPAGADRLRPIAERLANRVRLQDILALRESNVALLMPDTDAADAARAAQRLLRAERAGPGSVQQADESAGIATVFGDVEGGADALMAAAEAALADAAPGQVLQSKVLSGRPRVLVVDDDETFAQVLAEAITERGWEGHPCSQVADARERVLDGTYSALFIDLVLPGTSGVELLRLSLSAHPQRPGVLMSGYDADKDVILEALENGPVMFVRKPLSSADLEEALGMFRELLPGASKRRSGKP